MKAMIVLTIGAALLAASLERNKRNTAINQL